MGGALRFAGTMEIAGLNEDINPVRVRGIIAAAPKYYPEFEPSDFDGVAPWRGLRPCSPDGMPYVGRTAKCANLSIATGHAMMGMSLGPGHREADRRDSGGRDSAIRHGAAVAGSLRRAVTRR